MFVTALCCFSFFLISNVTVKVNVCNSFRIVSIMTITSECILLSEISRIDLEISILNRSVEFDSNVGLAVVDECNQS